MRRKSNGHSVRDFSCFPAPKDVFEHVPSQTHEKSRNDRRWTSFSKDSSQRFLAFPNDNSYRNCRQKPIKIRLHPLAKHEELSVGGSAQGRNRKKAFWFTAKASSYFTLPLSLSLLPTALVSRRTASHRDAFIIEEGKRCDNWSFRPNLTFWNETRKRQIRLVFKR